MVVKRDGRREKFDRQKVLEGLLKACEKRPVPMAKLAEVVDEVESKLSDNPDREIPTTEVGELSDEAAAGLDKIAYVRFASVYRDFQDVEAFSGGAKGPAPAAGLRKRDEGVPSTSRPTSGSVTFGKCFGTRF